MYKENCLIRMLAACETMGNATNICTDKTGTLTENRMTVVEGWFGDIYLNHKQLKSQSKSTSLSISNDNHIPISSQPAAYSENDLSNEYKDLIAKHVAVNRSAYYTKSKTIKETISKDNNTNTKIMNKMIINTALSTDDNEMTMPLINNQEKTEIIGNKTEASLMTFIQYNWGYNADELQRTHFNEDIDKLYAFNSIKKCSTAIVHLENGTIRLYSKGASEILLKSCSKYINQKGEEVLMTSTKRNELQKMIQTMARNALRTLILTHKDYESESILPLDWRTNPPDGQEQEHEHDLCCDAIVGIMDPLRPDVKEAVQTAQNAGVVVRMITGDNLATAVAIAKQAGILNETMIDTDGASVCMEGPTFRTLTPKQLDLILPRLRVIARASPEDKKLLVQRLNGEHLPKDETSWLLAHPSHTHADWEDIDTRDSLLPGYEAEWKLNHPEGGEVVGVTGDGTNDAPALKTADGK